METAYGLVKDYVEKYRFSAIRDTRLEVELAGGDADLVEAELYSGLADLIQPDNVDGAQTVLRVTNELASSRGIDADGATPFGVELRKQVRLALLELAEEDLSIFNGSSPRVGNLRFSAQPAPSMSVGAAAEQYRSQVLDTSKGTDRTKKKREVTLDFVLRHFGLDRSISAITRKDAIEFRDLIAKAPSNATKIFGNLSLQELSSKQSHKNYRVMAYNTQKTYLETASRFFEWAVDERLISLNPMRKIKSSADRVPDEEQRDPYTDRELNLIFAAPIYTGCLDDQKNFSVPGPNVIRRSRYWLPLIALFTGARPEEILQLTPAHIQVTENGLPFFAITRDMQLKTGASVREIPVHPTLIEAGFLQFVEQKRQSEGQILFTDVPIGSDGTRSGIWSKRYSTFSRSVGVKSEKNCFYSFRHTFRDALREAEIPEEQANRLQGWSSKGQATGRRYGKGYRADQLAPWMAKVSYPNVNLAHIVGSLTTKTNS